MIRNTALCLALFAPIALAQEANVSMDSAQVYKALAERMLVAADEVSDADRKASLLEKAEAAMQRAEEIRQREYAKGVPAATTHQMDDMLESIASIAQKVNDCAAPVLECKRELGMSKARDQELNDLVNRAVDRAYELRELADSGMNDMNDLRNELRKVLSRFPDMHDKGARGASLLMVSEAVDCIAEIRENLNQLESMQIQASVSLRDWNREKKDAENESAANGGRRRN